MLQDIIPAAQRKAVYSGYTVGVAVIGLLRIVAPDVGWLPSLEEAWLYLGGVFGVLAVGNTNVKPLDAEDDIV